MRHESTWGKVLSAASFPVDGGASWIERPWRIDRRDGVGVVVTIGEVAIDARDFVRIADEARAYVTEDHADD